MNRRVSFDLVDFHHNESLLFGVPQCDGRSWSTGNLRLVGGPMFDPSRAAADRWRSHQRAMIDNQCRHS